MGFNTNPLLGLFIIIIITLPWFLSIKGGASSFVNQGLKKDLLDKILESKVIESHGAFFGAHTLSIIMLFFPMSLFLFPSVLKMFKEFKSDDNFFLMAWILQSLYIRNNSNKTSSLFFTLVSCLSIIIS